MKKKLKHQKSDLDSFYESRIIICGQSVFPEKNLQGLLLNDGFTCVEVFPLLKDLSSRIQEKRYDLIIAGYNYSDKDEMFEYIEEIRDFDDDVAIITISDKRHNLEFFINNRINFHFTAPVDFLSLIRGIKKAIGDKKNSEIGMQFFDALFGIQFSTHKETHSRTFSHVIRTTKVYGKFLLFLYQKGRIDLTSWSLKNCLMASLVHDIGKLKERQDILYKEGGLSKDEYMHVKKHAWFSITTLLGSHNFEFISDAAAAIETVSGYNEKNLGAQTKLWMKKILTGGEGVFTDIEDFFSLMQTKPFIHSLNRDLLYIVFRHHDGVDKPYHSEEEIAFFSHIMGRKVERKLQENFIIDIVTNAITICDMYDALIDPSRDYRRSSYSSVFVLYLLFVEMKTGKFFEFIYKDFLEFIIEKSGDEYAIKVDLLKTGEIALEIFEKIYQNFRITRYQESDFSDFFTGNLSHFISGYNDPDDKTFIRLNNEWVDYFTETRKVLVEQFYGKLKEERIINKKIEDFSLQEIKCFDTLYKLYYSYSSERMKTLVINFFKEKVILDSFSSQDRKIISDALLNDKINSKKELIDLILNTYDEGNILLLFDGMDEREIIAGINSYISRISIV
ncbi:MAG: hypothetical protein JW982_13800 [Spirochaetes bacterium]|nr:hypothetical protein [Spirochaetota bacterium]